MCISIIFLLLNSSVTVAYEKEIRGLSSTLADSIAKSGKKTVAVVGFTDLQGNVMELGRFLVEEFSVALSESGKGFEVVDRTHLNSLLKEHQLALTGLIDPKTARKLGEIAGVHVLVTGTITPFGDNIRLAVKVLDVETAKVIGGSRGDIAKTKAIEELLGRGIETGTSAMAGATQAAPSSVQLKVLAKAEVNDFIFEAKECKWSGQRLICAIAVTNSAQKARRLVIYAWSPGRSILVDDRGNQYNSEGVMFGGRGSLEGSYSAENDNMPPILPMNIMISYREIHPNAKYGNVVIDCYYDGEDFKAVLRNIPLSR